MADQVPRTRLGQLVQAAHLSLPEFCGTFHEVATQQLGSPANVSVRQLKRWLSGEAPLPRPGARRILERWFGEPIETLFGPPLVDAPVPQVTTDTAEGLVNATARAIGQDAVAAAQSLPAGALEQWHAEAQRAARAYFTEPPTTLLATLVDLRSRVRDQLGRTGKPRQQAELHLILAQLSGLLASVATALAYLDAAEDLARAAHTYGDIIDQPSVCAWARALQVAAEFWAGRPRDAVTTATAALQTAPSGTARVRLYAVQARALARVGAHAEVRTAMAWAEDELDRAGGDAVLDEVGGELGFSRARVGLCGSSAFVLLRDAQAAECAAAAALDQFSLEPPDERWMAGEVGARIDLGAARVLRGDLAGAEHALTPVFDLAADRRTDALTKRLQNLDRLLATRPYRGAPESVRIGEQIAVFTRDSLVNKVPMLTARVG